MVAVNVCCAAKRGSRPRVWSILVAHRQNVRGRGSVGYQRALMKIGRPRAQDQPLGLAIDSQSSAQLMSRVCAPIARRLFGRGDAVVVFQPILTSSSSGRHWHSDSWKRAYPRNVAHNFGSFS